MSTCGKKKAWKTWMKYPSLTNTLLELCQQPVTNNKFIENMPVIERFVCLMYSATTNEHEVNRCRRFLFTKAGCQLESLPPTHVALIQHVLRAIYQSSFVWGQATTAMQTLPKPTDWGWTMVQDEFVPKWGNLPPIKTALREPNNLLLWDLQGQSLLLHASRTALHGVMQMQRRALRELVLCKIIPIYYT